MSYFTSSLAHDKPFTAREIIDLAFKHSGEIISGILKDESFCYFFKNGGIKKEDFDIGIKILSCIYFLDNLFFNNKDVTEI
jgi:hypothetical protein